MNATTIDAARRALGAVGAVLPVTFTDMPSVDEQREAVGQLERTGYRAAWTNEVLGKDALVQSAVLLGATERMVLGTSIANIWAREPQTMHAAAAQLADAYPGRFVLGMGVGYPYQAASTGRNFGSPLTTMRDYRDRMDSQTWPPAPNAAYPRIIAANGPKMLALAGEITDGALPAGLPPEFTAHARQVLGPDKLLVIGLSVVVHPDPDRARTMARETVSTSLGQPSYAATIGRLGYTDQEVTDVSDRLVDAIIGHGDPTAIAATVRNHLTAGADHVMIMLPPGGDFVAGIDQLEQLAPTLTAIG
jgi:probable F420-dependent oxidoreductase